LDRRSARISAVLPGFKLEARVIISFHYLVALIMKILLIAGVFLMITGILWGVFFFWTKLGYGYEADFFFRATMLRIVIPMIFVALGVLLIWLRKKFGR